ncbi:uncharacterized protein PAC_04296 [Phialocephala subalpina]|uniref:Uncharacterized protein n=1 Tax=Phialocephala subalpina TaxID=576137 RepID=A0A1L7WNQ7_9HELO|nr:uncharacterized protein PAC_04296 [Phialocephala subalpina]
MFSTFPSTPRGRSRFSKALPVAPDQSSAENEKSSTMMPTQSPLPPLPKDAMVPPKTIPRRPIGGQAPPAKPPSIRSLSSVYSDSPGLSRTISNGSSRDTKDSLRSGGSSEGDHPPPPPKDKEDQSREARTNILDSPISLTSSPQRPEIWKRRSVKSERSIVFPDLKLAKSNGSTASPPKRQEQPTERPLPRSITGRKPVPARPAPPQPDLMGNRLAKLEGKLENKLKKKPSSEDTSKQDEAPPQQYPSFQRLPTPEYLKADVQQPSTPQVLSPISPFTPPEETAPQLPPKAEARANHQHQNPTTKPPTMSDTEIPDLLATHSREPSETLTITSEPQVMRSPQPKKAFAARILTPQPSPDKASPLTLGSPAAHNTYFPTLQSPAAQGTVFPGPPLDLVHYDCYQSHKFMRGSRNQLCPVACMICQRKDAERFYGTGDTRLMDLGKYGVMVDGTIMMHIDGIVAPGTGYRWFMVGRICRYYSYVIV